MSKLEGSTTPTVAWLTNSTWISFYGRNPTVIGSTLRLNDASYQIVGILSAPFRFSIDGRVPELYIPLDSKMYGGSRAIRSLQAIGKLRPSVTLSHASGELKTIAERLQEYYPETNSHVGITVIDLREELIGSSERPIWLLALGVGLFLLIAMTNVANLLLVRSSTRFREVATRLSIGATPLRISLQYVAEGLAFGTAGGAVGLVLGEFFLAIVNVLLPLLHYSTNLTRIQKVSLKGAPFFFGLVLSVGVSVICGVVPALSVRRVDLNECLKQGGANLIPRTRRRWQSGLLIVDIGLSTVLLLTASLLLRSFINVSAVNPGFDAHDLVVFGIGLPDVRYDSSAKELLFYQAALARLKALPGIQAVGGIFGLPMAGKMVVDGFEFEGMPPQPPSERPTAEVAVASGSYFEAMRIRLIDGRFFTMQDDSRSSAVCLVNEKFVKMYLRRGHAIGKRLILPFSNEWFPKGTLWQIVGVIGDVHEEDKATEPAPQIFIPLTQLPDDGLAFVFRTKRPIGDLSDDVRQVINSLDPNLVRPRLVPMTKYVDQTLAMRRVTVRVTDAFAFVALILCAIGVFSVLSYAANLRTRELGIRLALGANRRDIISLLMSRGIIICAIGFFAGASCEIAFSRLVSKFLFGIQPTDPITFLFAGSLFAAINLIASYLPARKAANRDVLSALRYE
ncbi:MAG: FtsX-like permease family protein [Candidatus Acidiferrales bacterium]